VQLRPAEIFSGFRQDGTKSVLGRRSATSQTGAETAPDAVSIYVEDGSRE